MSEMWKDVIKMPLSARHCQEPRLLLYVCMRVGVGVHSVCIQVAVVSSTADDMKQRCVRMYQARRSGLCWIAQRRSSALILLRRSRRHFSRADIVI